MTEKREICPDCQTGCLSEEVYSEEIRYRDQMLVVEGLKCWVCDHCGAEIIRADQVREGDKLIAEARRCADGLLSGDEIRAIRTSLKLTQKQASELFGGGQNAFSKYERGEVIQSVAMDRLVRLAAENATVFRRLQQLAGVATEHARVEQRQIRLRTQYGDDPPSIPRRDNVVSGPWTTTRKVA